MRRKATKGAVDEITSLQTDDETPSIGAKLDNFRFTKKEKRKKKHQKEN